MRSGRRANLKKPSQTLKRYSRCTLELSPKLVEAHLNLEPVYMRQREYAEAQAELQRAIDVKPNYLERVINFFGLHAKWTKEAGQEGAGLSKALEEEDKREQALRQRRRQAREP